MTPSEIWLAPAAIETLTGRKRWTAQCRALATLGIPYRLSAQGRPLVEARAVLTHDPTPPTPTKSPRWDRLRAA